MKIYSGWMVNVRGVMCRATIRCQSPDMGWYMANFKARRVAR